MVCTIRHLEPDDVPALHAILTSPNVVDGSMRLPYSPLSSTAARLVPKDGHHVLVAEDDGEVLGFAELATYPHIPRHAHAGELYMIAVREDRQGQGIGRSLVAAVLDLADRWLMLDRIGLVVWVRNTHAVKLYESFGFQIEGTLRQYARWQGTLIDAHTMGRLRAS